MQERMEKRSANIRIMGMGRTRDLFGWELRGGGKECRKSFQALLRVASSGRQLPPEWRDIPNFHPVMEYAVWTDEEKFERFVSGEWDEDAPYLLSVADFGPVDASFQPWSLATDGQAWRSALIRALEAASQAMVAVFGCPPLTDSVSYRMLLDKLRTLECKGVAHAFIANEVHAAFSRTFELFRTGRARGPGPQFDLRGGAAFLREIEDHFALAYERIPNRSSPSIEVAEFLASDYGKIQWTSGGLGGKVKRARGSQGAARQIAQRAAVGTSPQAAAGAGSAAAAKGAGQGAGAGQSPAGAARIVCGYHLLGLLDITDRKTGVVFVCRLKKDGTCPQDKVHPRSLGAITKKRADEGVAGLPLALAPLGKAGVNKAGAAAFKP